MQDIVQYTRQLISDSTGGTVDSSFSHDSTIAHQLQYYNAELPSKLETDSVKASGYIVPHVQTVIDATLAEILPTFYSSKLSNNDELNEIATSLNVTTVIKSALFDSLLHGTAYAKTYIETKQNLKHEYYNDINSFQLLQIVQNGGEIVEQEQTSELTFNVKVRYINESNEIKIDNIAPENLIIASDTTEFKDCQFIAQEVIINRNELVSLGIDKEIAETIPSFTSSESQYQRSDTIEDSEDTVLIYDCYVQFPDEETGLLEDKRVILDQSSNEALLIEDYDKSPFQIGVTLTKSHSIFGESLATRNIAIQDEKSYLTRSIIDNVKSNNKGRLLVNPEQTNLDDLQNAVAGGIVRTTNITSSVTPLSHSQTDSNSVALLQLFDSDAQSQVTATRPSDSSISTASGLSIERQLSKTEQGTALLAKTFSDTFVYQLFEQIAHLANIELTTPLIINVGNSYNERQRKANVLRETLSYQEKLKAMGSNLFQESKVYQTLDDLLELGNIKDCGKYFNAPDSEAFTESQNSKAQSQQEQQAKEIEQLKMQQQIAQSQVQLAQAEMLKTNVTAQNNELQSQIEQLKTIIDKNETTRELEFKYYQEQLKMKHNEERNALELTKLELDSNKDLNKQVGGNIL